MPPVLGKEIAVAQEGFLLKHGKALTIYGGITMKAVAIVGFKNSGKSSLVLSLAEALKKKGYTVGIVKHCQEKINMVEKDKPFSRFAKEIAIVSDKEISRFSKKFLTLEDIISTLSLDYVLVEGFKQNKTLPRIVCFKNEKEKKELIKGLEIAFVKKEGFNYGKNITKLVSLLEKKAFKLPGVNCGRCGFKTCYDLAQEIIKQNQKPSVCVYSNGKVRLWIEDRPIFLNPFAEDILKNVVSGFVKSLKGAKKSGKIKIEIGE